MQLFIPMTTELTEENRVFFKEVVPRTQRALFVLRISFCVAAAALGFAKVNLIPPLSSFYVDVLSDRTLDLRPGVQALNLLVSGLLAACLALIVATFLIQARMKASAGARYTGESEQA